MKLMVILTACLFGMGCASVPAPEPVAVAPIKAQSGQGVVTDQLILLVDSSGTIDNFDEQKALVGSIVSALPDGSYQAGTVIFGGSARNILSPTRFDRSALANHAQSASHLSEGTPIVDVLVALQEGASKRSRTAIVLLSDGLATDASGSHQNGTDAMAAAKELVEAYGGNACFHTVQVEADPAGGAWLQELSGVTPCGTSHAASNLTDADSLQAFARSVMLGAAPVRAPAPTPTAKPKSDTDADGVGDASDRCPGTPASAAVDFRGCWVIPGLNFASGSAEIGADGRMKLDSQVVPVLRADEDLKVRIDGHTDSSGSAALNQRLSERRANAVKAYLESEGIDASRLTARGFGAQQPAVPNDTKANKRTNRRTEITAVE